VQGKEEPRTRRDAYNGQVRKEEEGTEIGRPGRAYYPKFLCIRFLFKQFLCIRFTVAIFLFRLVIFPSKSCTVRKYYEKSAWVAYELMMT
jgi:hypothetical protein